MSNWFLSVNRSDTASSYREQQEEDSERVRAVLRVKFHSVITHSFNEKACVKAFHFHSLIQ